MANFVINGLIIGFSVAAPIGPIGLLCIRRTLDEGKSYGLVTGFAAASVDAIYATIAGFGLTFLSNILIRYHIMIRIVGGIGLCYLGIQTIRSKPNERPSLNSKSSGLVNSYGTTFFLMITNPMTILFFTAIFAGIGGVSGSYFMAILFVLGVFIGSMIWWILLVVGTSIFRTKVTPPRLLWINRLSGLILIGFAFIILLNYI